jgi:predicted MFS family arabinose efflux permease
MITAVCAITLFLAPRSYNESRPLTTFRLGGLFALSNFKSPFRALQMSPGLSRLALACVGFAMMQSAVFSFFVIYLHAGLGYSLVLAGGLFAILQGASVVGRIFFGFAADRIGAPRAVLMTLAASSSVSALTLAALTPDLSLLVLTAISLFIGSSVSTWNGLYLAEAARLAPTDMVSEAVAGTTFFVFAVYTVTPPLFGFMIDRYGYSSAFILGALSAALSGIVVATAPRSIPVQSAEQS